MTVVPEIWTALPIFALALVETENIGVNAFKSVPLGINISILVPVIVEEIAPGMLKAVIKLSPDDTEIELPL